MRSQLMLLLLLTTLGTSEVFAQYAPGSRWLQRETRQFLLIYPDTMSEEADRLAGLLDEALDEARDGLAPNNDHGKWPLILSDLGLEANGYVSLAPRKSVWYSVPGEEFAAVSDWWMLLAEHEGRHMAQFDSADQGFTRFLHALFGEQGWGAGLVLGTPLWLLEGDAVVGETRRSLEGRGRDPLFTREMEALIAEQPDLDYRRLTNPSYRIHIPNHYYTGYFLTDWLRSQYGEVAVEAVYRRVSRLPLPVIGIGSALRESTGRRPNELYREMSAAWRKEHETLPFPGETVTEPGSELSEPPTEFSPQSVLTLGELSRPGGVYTRWDGLFDAGERGLYARRITIKDAPALVRISADGRETELCHLPEGGRISITESDGSLLVLWNSLRRIPPYTGVSVSDLSLLVLDERDRIVRRRTIAAGTRYLYPALSPDGHRIAAVQMIRGEDCRLTILDTGTTEILHWVPLGKENAAYPSWSPDGSRIVFSLASPSGRCIAEWRIGEGLVRPLTETGFFTVKTPVYSQDSSTVYFTSNAFGRESLQSVGTGSGNTSVGGPVRPPESPDFIASARWGLTDPARAASDGEILVLGYDSVNGERILSLATPVPNAVNVPTAVNSQSSGELAVNSSGQFPTIPLVPAVSGTRDREESSDRSAVPIAEDPPAAGVAEYSIPANSLNFHSWGLVPGSDFPDRPDIRLYTRSTDLLGTSSLELGGEYDFIEESPGTYLDYTWSGSRPLFSLRIDYFYRSPHIEPVHQLRAGAVIQYPANLSRNGIWEHQITPALQGGVLQRWPADSAGNVRNQTLPYLDYSISWSRTRSGSVRAIRPDLGWSAFVGYSQIPVPGDYGDSRSALLKIYLPGGFPNTSLMFSGAYERRTAGFAPRVSTARGYSWSDPPLLTRGSVDYEFPLVYPDWPIGSLIFIQRFRAGLYSDFAFLGTASAFTGGLSLARQWSSGISLTMDFSAFNNFQGFSLGLRFNWLWQESRPGFDLLLMDLALF